MDLTDTPQGYIIVMMIYPRRVSVFARVYTRNEIIMEKIDDVMVNMEENFECPACSSKHKDRADKELKDLLNRLKRIEGQVRGVEKMVESGAYCTDILTQVSAINSALNSFNKVLLLNHLKSCVVENIRNGNDEVIGELVTTMQKLMR